MLRTSVLAVACIAVLNCGPSRAEAVKAGAASPADAAAQSASPKTALSSDAQDGGTPAAAQAGSADKSAAEGSKGESEPKADSDTKQDSKDASKKAAEPAKPVAPPPPSLTAQIDLGSQEMTVSEHGQVKYTWAISSGTSQHPTPRGTFHPQWTSKMWYSKKYDNAPMPNAVFISGGVAIHATYATSMLGRPASHGCIRLAPANAAMFYKLVHQHGMTRTRVSVFGTPNWRSPAIASRQNRDGERVGRTAERENASSGGSGGLGWLFGDDPKPAAPAYYQGGARKVYRRPPPPPGYVYADQVRPRVYRSYDGSKVYYVQRPRRAYYNGYSASNW